MPSTRSLIVDASVAHHACLARDGFALLDGNNLAAPPLMWSETRSVLRTHVWRGAISTRAADLARSTLATCPITCESPAGLGDEAWRIAEELGWAKTYDAEYLALARLLGGRVITLDGRLRRGAGRTGLVITPAEL